MSRITLRGIMATHDHPAGVLPVVLSWIGSTATGFFSGMSHAAVVLWCVSLVYTGMQMYKWWHWFLAHRKRLPVIGDSEV